MTVSIIIAVKTRQKNLEECVKRCQELDSADFETLILPDSAIGTFPTEGTILIKIIPTGPVRPAKKRDIAVDYASGEILAFIDDDAYPAKDWLKNALKNFFDPMVAAVAGPAITPPEDNLMQRASGLVYAAFFVSGQYVYRYLPKTKREVEDYPSCNFLVRKSVMEELGGFKTNFWPGEDTKLCLDITRKLGKKIIYDPEVLVYHHRRPLFLPHLKQIASYGLHRGYFVKRYPQTSLKFSYFVPALFLCGLAGGLVVALLFPPVKTIYFSILFLYFLLVCIFSINKELRLIPSVFCGIILSHLAYGFFFLKGLFSENLKEERSRGFA